MLKSWFGGSSASPSPPAASNGPPAAANSAGSRGNVWRSVFDPGSNPNIDRVGSQYYDNVKDPKASPTTWDMILRSQSGGRRSFSDIDRNKDGFVDAQELADAMPPSPPSTPSSAASADSTISSRQAAAAALIASADPAKPGRLNRQEYQDVLDKYFMA